MMNKRKARRNPLSKIQKKYARILYERGLPQNKIAEIFKVSEQTISAIKKKDGDWDVYKLPQIEPADILENMEHILLKFQISLLAGDDDEDITRAVLNIHKIANALKDLQELILSVSVRNEILACQNIMTWLAANPRDHVLEAIQEYHDLKVSEL